MRRKVVLVGDSVGKTSLVWRALAENKGLDLEDFPPTVLSAKDLVVKVDGEEIVLSVIDTAGQEEYDQLRPLSYTDTDMFILLCALNQKDSLLNIRFKWIREVKHYSPNSRKVLAVTRCDLTDSSNTEEITDEMINVAKRDLELEAAYKVSAKTGENVEEMLEDIARRVKVKPVKRVSFCRPL